MLKGFKAFLMRGDLITLAVAFVMGTAFATLVTSLVDDIIMQIIAALGGAPDFSDLHAGPVKYGEFLTAVATFVIIAAAVYAFVVTPYNAYRSRRGLPAADATPADIQLLTEIRDLLQARVSGGADTTHST
ncbi:MAG: large conductance mechanosensitive channel protein MscL [Carbonactinosporaceae bacterium]